MKVKDIMTRSPIVVRESASLEEIARLMLDQRIGGVPVVDIEGRLSGIVTESDFCGDDAFVPFTIYQSPRVLQQWIGPDGVERIYAAARSLTARDVMRVPVITADEDESVTDLVKLMIHHDIARVPVVRDGAPIGIVTRHDLLRLIVNGDLHGAPSNETPGGSRNSCSE
jgi:CBS domain-containing protein